MNDKDKDTPLLTPHPTETPLSNERLCPKCKTRLREIAGRSIHGKEYYRPTCRQCRGHCGTIEDYERIYEEQGGVCAICGQTDDPQDPLVQDHDPSTGKLRGLLCRNCNIGLGHFRDDRLRVYKALKYLTDHRKE